MKKGERVHVVFRDISASLHSTERLPVAMAEVCGWILSARGKDVEIVTCRYFAGHDEMDRITIPKGAIESCEVI